jgi:hypothetical protein
MSFKYVGLDIGSLRKVSQHSSKSYVAEKASAMKHYSEHLIIFLSLKNTQVVYDYIINNPMTLQWIIVDNSENSKALTR